MSGVLIGAAVGAGVPLGLLGLQWLGLVLAERRALVRGHGWLVRRDGTAKVDLVKVMRGR